jgi:hypothetical protein
MDGYTATGEWAVVVLFVAARAGGIRHAAKHVVSATDQFVGPMTI